ncbi:hypothetical protein [Myroides odoratus]|uniref:hypothetical protein n=1 Tax=Myroides odoratus TaxID=256 RepID=UPI003342DDC2
MNQKRGKKINFLPIIIVLILLSAGSSWVLSIASLPVQMGHALVTGELYTGRLERVVDERGSVAVGITATGSDGNQVFIPAERLEDITHDFFSDVDQAVFLDAEGGTFWLTYEDLILAYIILVLVFLVCRMALFLTLFVLHAFAIITNQTAAATRKGIHLLIKPLRMLMVGYILVVFYQYRIFGSKEEAESFSIFILIFALYFLYVISRRLMDIRSSWIVQTKKDRLMPQAVTSSSSEKAETPTAMEKQVFQDNELIKRQKTTFKHQTSRYN